MKILLLGANGQVGWELRRSLVTFGQIHPVTKREVDLAHPNHIRAFLSKNTYDVIVNAAAYTAVDKAEEEIEKARFINTDSVSILAQEAFKQGAFLVHYSTDYVFDGTKSTPYEEGDTVNPLNIYGETKFAGEEAIRSSGCKHFIFRTSWVYASRGANFVKTILKLAQERKELKIINDQVGSPTAAELIADVTAHCLVAHKNSITNDTKWGTFHLTASGKASWYDFAQYIIKEANQYDLPSLIDSTNILPIPTHEYPLPAKRPANSLLDTSKILNTFTFSLPSWKYHVQRVVNELVKSWK